MTQILASVRSLAEAQLMLDCDIDILDLKEPDAGALGAIAPAIARAVVIAASGECRVSAAAGCVGDADVLTIVDALGRSGVDFVKIGFAEPVGVERLKTLRQLLPGPVGAVAVLFADCPEIVPVQWPALLQAAGFAGVMLDTAGKTDKTLADCISPRCAQAWVAEAHAHGLFCGLAGRLSAESAEQFLPAGADYLGFRSALCPDRRRGDTLCAATATGVLERLRRAMLGPEDKIGVVAPVCLSPAQK